MNNTRALVLSSFDGSSTLYQVHFCDIVLGTLMFSGSRGYENINNHRIIEELVTTVAVLYKSSSAGKHSRPGDQYDAQIS